MRIYIDSRYRTPDSASASDFTIELLETIQLPRETKVRLHDISVPYSWRTVEEGLNQEIWLEEFPGGIGPASTKRLLKLPAGQYDGKSLGIQMQTLFNTGSAWSLVANGGVATPYSVSYSEGTGTIRIALAPSLVGFATIWSDFSIKAVPVTGFAGGDFQSPRTFNRNLRVSTNVVILPGTPWNSEFVDLITIKDLYVHSTSLGNLTNIGPRAGDRSCLCKVAITGGYGYLIHSDTADWEYADCNPGLLKRLSFTLRDSTGAIVPLHGCDWSFALTFNDPADQIPQPR